MSSGNAVKRRSVALGGSIGPVRTPGDVGPQPVDLGARQARLDGRPCDLTSHQFELLTVLAQSPGRVLSRDQIMDALKGHPLEAFDRVLQMVKRNEADPAPAARSRTGP